MSSGGEIQPCPAVLSAVPADAGKGAALTLQIIYPVGEMKRYKSVFAPNLEFNRIFPLGTNEDVLHHDASC